MAKSKVGHEVASEPASLGKGSDRIDWRSAQSLNAINESIQVKKRLAENCLEDIVQMAEVIADALRQGHKVAFFGNGGSAADAQHIAAELVGKFEFMRPPLRAIALTTNSSIVTAIGNDFAFDQIFSRQVAAQIDDGDVVVGISTSGSSKNVINGIHQARKLGAKTIAFTGESGRQLSELCDHHVMVPSTNTQRIQESHIMIGHIVCGLVERSLVERPSKIEE